MNQQERAEILEGVKEKGIIKIIEKYIPYNELQQCLICRVRDIFNKSNFTFNCVMCDSYICDDCYNSSMETECYYKQCKGCIIEQGIYQRCSMCSKLICKMCYLTTFIQRTEILDGIVCKCCYMDMISEEN